LILEGTKKQLAVLIPLFVLGILAVIFTSIMTATLLQNTDDYPDTNISEALVFYASIDLIFWFPFFILYKKWKLKWDWRKFIPSDF